MGKGVISMASRTAEGVREVISKAHESSSPKWSAFREKMGDLLKRGAEKAGIGAKAAGRFIANKTKDFSSDFRAGYHAFMVSYDARHMDKLEARIMEAREFRDRAADRTSSEARKIVSPDFAVHASDLDSFDRRSMAAADAKAASRFWEDELKASADLTMRPEDIWLPVDPKLGDYWGMSLPQAGADMSRLAGIEGDDSTKFDPKVVSGLTRENYRTIVAAWERLPDEKKLELHPECKELGDPSANLQVLGSMLRGGIGRSDEGWTAPPFSKRLYSALYDVANKTPQATMDEIAAEIKAEDAPAVKSPSAEQGKFSFSKASEEMKALSLKGLDGLQLAAAQFSSFIDRVKSGELDSTSEDFRKNVDQATTMMRRLASLEELGVADGASTEPDLGVDFDG